MQSRRGWLFLGLAALLGLLAALSAERWLEQRAAEVLPEIELEPVLVANVDLPVASELTPRRLEVVSWPAQHVPRDALRDVASASGRVLRRPLQAGEPVLASALMEEGSRGGLTALLDPSKRAMSVRVDPVIGVAGFVKPGARVDVLATLRRIDENANPYAKMILQDVRVLAVDQQLEQARGAEPELVSVVTLEVEPHQAEQLTFAAHEGNLQLALRSPATQETVETAAVSVLDLIGVRPPPTPRPAGRPRAHVQVIQGAEVRSKAF